MKYDVPIGLEITLKVGCPNMCSYCPQELLLSKYTGAREFTLESFQHCLRSVPVKRNLTFMGAVEPFLCKDAVPIIRWAYQRGHGMSISTTLRNATHEAIDALADIPFTDTIVHVPADDGRMKLDVTDEWLELFKHAIAAWRHHPDFVISVFGIAHPRIRPIWEASGIPVVNFGLHSRVGKITLPGVAKVRHAGKLPICGKQFCGHLFPNGDVARCCNDYEMACVWGNLNTQTYKEIYTSEKFRAYIKALGDPDSEVPCRYCNDWYKQVNVEDRGAGYDLAGWKGVFGE